MNRFVFRPGTRVSSNITPEVVGKALADIHDKHGNLTPALVVKSARPKRSPIHGEFTWDDSEAGRLHREMEARALIRCILVIPEDKGGKTPTPRHVYHNVPPKDHAKGRTGVYVDTVTLVADPDMFARAVDKARGRLIGAQASLAELETLARATDLPKIQSAAVHIEKARADLDSLE